MSQFHISQLMLFTRPVTIANHCQLHVRHWISRIVDPSKRVLPLKKFHFSSYVHHFHHFCPKCYLLPSNHMPRQIDFVEPLRSRFGQRSRIMFYTHTTENWVSPVLFLGLFTEKWSRHPYVTIVFHFLTLFPTTVQIVNNVHNRL